MIKDNLDKLLWLLLLIVVSAMAALLGTHSKTVEKNGSEASVTKAMEREMAYQARVALLQKLYRRLRTCAEMGIFKVPSFVWMN